jgi:hypothetical protein
VRTVAPLLIRVVMVVGKSSVPAGSAARLQATLGELVVMLFTPNGLPSAMHPFACARSLPPRGSSTRVTSYVRRNGGTAGWEPLTRLRVNVTRADLSRDKLRAPAESAATPDQWADTVTAAQRREKRPLSHRC